MNRAPANQALFQANDNRNDDQVLPSTNRNTMKTWNRRNKKATSIADQLISEKAAGETQVAVAQQEILSLRQQLSASQYQSRERTE